MNKRRNNISRVYRKVSEEPRPLINTIEGLMRIIVSKHCQCCKTMQPLNNFYFKSASKRKARKYDDNNPKSRESICISCWDENNQ